jgi:hypothetical protein
MPARSLFHFVFKTCKADSKGSGMVLEAFPAARTLSHRRVVLNAEITGLVN